MVPKFKIAPLESNDKSSPTLISAATPRPPPTVKAPEVELLEAVLAEILTTPPDEILIASASLVLPIVPASGMTRLVPKVAVEAVIAVSYTPLRAH